MKNKLVSLTLMVSSALFLTLSSCKKESASSEDYTPEFATQIDEQMLISAEIDGVTVDAISAMEAAPYFKVNPITLNSICNGTIEVKSRNPFTVITITYNGVNCANMTGRKGTVELTMKENNWLDANTVLSVKYNNIQVKRLRDNKTIVLNGTVNITNESGGGLYNIMNSPLTHSISSTDMRVTFSDGVKRPWKISVNRVFSFDNGLVLTTTGNGSAGGVENISAAGLTHDGAPFTTVIEEPMIIREDCYFRLVSAKLLQIQQEVLTLRFGLDASGNPTTCPGTNAYFLKATWPAAVGAGVIMMPY